MQLPERSLAGASLGQSFEDVDIAPGTVRALVLITVNAVRDPNVRLDEMSRVPGALLGMDAMRFGAGSRATHETQEFLRDLADEWRANVQRNARDTIFAPDVQIHIVRVNLRDTPLPLPQRTQLLQIPTAFTVRPQEADQLVAAGRAALRNNPSFQVLQAALQTPRPAHR